MWCSVPVGFYTFVVTIRANRFLRRYLSMIFHPFSHPSVWWNYSIKNVQRNRLYCSSNLFRCTRNGVVTIAWRLLGKDDNGGENGLRRGRKRLKNPVEVFLDRMQSEGTFERVEIKRRKFEKSLRCKQCS